VPGRGVRGPAPEPRWAGGRGGGRGAEWYVDGHCVSFVVYLFADVDTAEYLHHALPSGWVTTHAASKARIAAALQEERLKSPTAVFEERVARALAALGPRPA
jgi:hypothetical protein